VACAALSCRPREAAQSGAANTARRSVVSSSISTENETFPCGSFARSEYHYDRNAITSSVIVDDSVLAITRAGHLLRFALGSLAVTGESLSAESALVWGPVQQGSELAAFAGGRIGRVRAAPWPSNPSARFRATLDG